MEKFCLGHSWESKGQVSMQDSIELIQKFDLKKMLDFASDEKSVDEDQTIAFE